MHFCKSWQPLSSCLLDRHITAAPPFSALSRANLGTGGQDKLPAGSTQKPENSAFLGCDREKSDAPLRPDLPSISRGTWGEPGPRAERRAKLGCTWDAGPHRGRCLN
jgi:hypothetical protein